MVICVEMEQISQLLWASVASLMPFNTVVYVVPEAKHFSGHELALLINLGEGTTACGCHWSEYPFC